MAEGEFIAWFILWFVGVFILGFGWMVYHLLTNLQELLGFVLFVGFLLGAIVVPTALGIAAFRVHGMVFGR